MEWHHPDWWRDEARTSLLRTAVKTVVYRIISATSTILIAGIMFGNWSIAGAFGMVDLIANTLLYFTYERLWGHIIWQKMTQKVAQTVRKAKGWML